MEGEKRVSPGKSGTRKEDTGGDVTSRDKGAEIRRREGIPDEVVALPLRYKKEWVKRLIKKGYSSEEIQRALKVTPRVVVACRREVEEEMERALVASGKIQELMPGGVKVEQVRRDDEGGIKVSLSLPEAYISRGTLLSLALEALQHGQMDLDGFLRNEVIPFMRVKREIEMLMGRKLSPYEFKRLITSALEVLGGETG